jgi:hypothetical protein
MWLQRCLAHPAGVFLLEDEGLVAIVAIAVDVDAEVDADEWAIKLD